MVVRGTVMLGTTIAATAIIALVPAGWHDARPPMIADTSIAILDTAAPNIALNPAMRSQQGSKLELAQSPSVDPNNVGGPRNFPSAIDLGRPLPTSSYRVNGVYDSDVLNIRSEPNADSNVVGTIPPDGRGIRISGQCSAGWCPIQYNGVQGWANGRYLTKE